MDQDNNNSVMDPNTDVPPPPGESPIPEGNVRLYHQTAASNIPSILKNGITFENAKGIEGPKAIYADEKGFYGKPGKVPTIEFSIPKERWTHPPFVLEDVKPSEIVAAHLPWHETVRYLEGFRDQIKRTLQGDHDEVMDGSGSNEDKAVRYIKQKYKPHKDNGGGITAYQGGPHSVGEEGFLDEKIGTGEGAQAYGHGHYFAEAEPVAQGYRDALAQQQNPTTSINDLISKMSKVNPERMTPQIIQYYMKLDPMLSPHADDKEVVGHISEALNGQNADGSVSESAIDAYGKLTDKFGRNHKGHMHEVSINAHPDHFLDWDKPLSEQSPHIVKNIFDARKDNPTLFNVFKPHLEKDSTGMDFYQSLATKHPNGDKGASEFLQRSGISGIKYLDASSRSKGEGTRNYVVFDPKIVDIKRRYEKGGEVDDDGITAYHSSPHDFDEFDTAKIGTGEGNQMYGHGLYFAENPEVSGQGGQYYNQFMNKMKSSPERHATAALWANKFDRDKAIASLDRSHAYHSDKAIPGRYANGPDAEEGDRLLAEEYKEGADYLRSGKIAGPRTYEVSINAHQDHMLDWDKTIDEQSDYVKNALNKTEWWPWTKERIEDRAGRHGANPQGRHVYNDLSEDYSLEEATNFLQDAGIKGVRYLDAGSRNSGKGTHNYVVFDHKNVNVKRKYKDGGEVDDGITAYHGSPHDFDQFDMAKIGKGVGEQAYGHGLYFTEHEPTAIDFRDRATASKNINDFNLYRISGSNEEFEPQKQGHMYEVNISAHPDHMLDWNKPLSEQSPYIVKSIFDSRKDNPTLFNVFKSHFEKNSTGMDFYQALATKHPNGYQGASEFLQRSGVHGVKYRDENSRDKGKGTTNYVVFDPKNVDVKRKYEDGGRIGYDYGGDVRTGDNPGGAADANRPAATSRDANRNYNVGSGTQTAGPSSNNRPDNRPDNSNDRFNIGGGGAPMPPQRGDDSFFSNMGGNIGSVLGGLAFGPLGSIGGRYLGNQFNQPDNSRFEAKNDEFGNPIGNNGGWLDFLGNSGNPPAPMTSDNRRDPIIKPIKRKRRILMPDGTYQEVEEDMKSGGVAKSYNRVHNSKIVEHALSKVGVSLHTRRPPS